jgi:DNA-binding HxlR family transcriptional regulator
MTPRPATEHEPRACDAALSRAFEFLGKRWNGMLLGTLGAGPAGFAELKRALGISDSVLSDRLAELTRAGLIVREVDEGPPLAVTYVLTESGAAIQPALRSLTAWATGNLSEEQCRETR